MSDAPPPMPPPGERPQRAEDPVPNPHRTEPVPTPEEGMRPGVDPAVRPEQDEPLGPAAGLVTAAGAEASQEASEVTGETDAEAEALLAQMGVEEEGIEGGQLLGLVAATLFAVAALAVVLIYLFYIPLRQQTQLEADAAQEAEEIDILRAEALAKLEQYTREDETYGVPIERAMGLVALEYGAASEAGLPADRAGWNVLPVQRGMGNAIQPTDAEPSLLPPTTTAIPAAGLTGERVGQDVDVETIETVDPDDLDEDLDNDLSDDVVDDLE